MLLFFQQFPLQVINDASFDQVQSRTTPLQPWGFEAFTSQQQSPLPAGDTEGPDWSTLRLTSPWPHTEARSLVAQTGNKGRGNFLIQSQSLKSSPPKIAVYEFAQCPFCLLEADEKGINRLQKPGCCLDELPLHQCVTAESPDCAYLKNDPARSTSTPASTSHAPWSDRRLLYCSLHHQENKKAQWLTTFLFILQHCTVPLGILKGFNLELHLERVPALVAPCKESCTIARNCIWCNSGRIFFLFCKAR